MGDHEKIKRRSMSGNLSTASPILVSFSFLAVDHFFFLVPAQDFFFLLSYWQPWSFLYFLFIRLPMKEEYYVRPIKPPQRTLSFLNKNIVAAVEADLSSISFNCARAEKRRSLPARKIIIKKRRTPAMGYDLWIPNPPELYSF